MAEFESTSYSFGDLSGEMDQPIMTVCDDDDFDEPVRETIMRDLRDVAHKFKHVVFPLKEGSNLLLRDWDLWGPLLLCMVVGAILHEGQGGPHFTQFFVLFWMGSAVVTINNKLLGGTISFFQSVCVLGYCIAPLFALRFIVTLVAFGWSSRAAMCFIGDTAPSDRRFLAVYPMVLFYFIISWLVITYSG
ncbi:Oidioi.mRNA.OKI2018_I69.XSR.g15131.t2.cds [Oikopleura dioica]|uniref:Protein YIPF n=1 Tax=Oikopleura dioica TaxID=34765 RepID=A0ABN7SDM6_OIKDI|nr:Oidioi.mRNA.OKI2018_I69.XSR.g15131.t2.cds [Oikopleura dioica]